MSRLDAGRFLQSDHLGSTTVSVNSNGAKVAELRYAPWGETRSTAGTTPTDYRSIGQRHVNSTGVYYYGAH